jgi:hypothetical protein
VATHQHGLVFGDQMCEIHESRTGARHPRQDQDLGSVILHMLFHGIELMGGLEGVLVDLSLRRRSPVHVGFPHRNYQVEGQDSRKGDQSRPPRDQEHDQDAQDGTRKTQPHVVVLQNRYQLNWSSFRRSVP